MSLTGSFFFAVVVVATAVVFLAVVFTWPRLAGPAPATVLARVGLLVVVNLLVLLAAAVKLNDTYLFYASWTDLHGAFTGSVAQTHLSRGGSAAKAAGQTVTGPAAAAPSRSPTLPKGTWHNDIGTFQVRGRASGLTGTIAVQLPPGYRSHASASRRYPVLEAFSGYPGSPYQWIVTMNLGGAVATQVAAKHMTSALIVQPEQWFPNGADSECVNGSPGNPQVETWIAVDVPDWIAQHFRVSTKRDHWAAIGLSAGAYCANLAALRHPAQYGAAISMGGYFQPDLSPFYQPYPPGSRLAAHNDLIALARHAPPPTAVWLETSHADALSYHSSASFLRAAHKPLAVHAVVLRNVGHRLSVWEALLPESLQWLGASLPGFH